MNDTDDRFAAIADAAKSYANGAAAPTGPPRALILHQGLLPGRWCAVSTTPASGTTWDLHGSADAIERARTIYPKSRVIERNIRICPCRSYWYTQVTS